MTEVEKLRKKLCLARWKLRQAESRFSKVWSLGEICGSNGIEVLREGALDSPEYFRTQLAAAGRDIAEQRLHRARLKLQNRDFDPNFW